MWRRSQEFECDVECRLEGPGPVPDTASLPASQQWWLERPRLPGVKTDAIVTGDLPGSGDASCVTWALGETLMHGGGSRHKRPLLAVTWWRVRSWDLIGVGRVEREREWAWVRNNTNYWARLLWCRPRLPRSPHNGLARPGPDKISLKYSNFSPHGHQGNNKLYNWLNSHSAVTHLFQLFDL